MGDTNDRDDDLKAARQKYRLERDKRLRGGNRQIAEISGDLSRYVADPYTPVQPRPPLCDEVDVVCIGAGFAGLTVAARLKEAGFDRVRLIDSAGDVGGVWYWNRYPEAKCDVESLIYMPLLEETGYMPTMHYASAPEIGEHARRIARHYDLYRDAAFHTTVTELKWDEDRKTWRIRSDRNDDMRSQFVILCNGALSRLKLPDIPGFDQFEGKSFHTSRWDYAYTGGGPTDPDLAKLKDKTVGVIGTGATGLQVVAPLSRSSGHLYLFQRTPSTVGVRANTPIDPCRIADLSPGWQRRRQENFTAINFGSVVSEDLVQDSWTDLFLDLNNSPTYHGLSGEALAREKERVDFIKMEAIRQRIQSVVKDPATAELLKPYYNYMCKRPGWHDDYLAAFNRPNVTLVDTQGAGVERLTKNGLVANGKEYPLDLLIFGTGFEVETGGRLRMGFDVVGKEGRTLDEKWAGGLSTLHGFMASGFPNLLIVPGVNSQAVVTYNVTHMIQEYADHFAYILKSVRERGASTFEANQAAEDEWVSVILERRVDDEAFLEACTPGRNNYEGKVHARPRQNTVFGGGAPEFFALLKRWRDAGDFHGIQCS